jgi:hypothetical protein
MSRINRPPAHLQQWAGYAMDGVPEPAKEWTGASGMWAPEAVKFGQTYYLYYCASQFGKNQSFIGVATSDSAEGPWTDQGEVYKTTKGSRPNAIDPNIVFDKQGNPWLIYGSFFGGIYANRLDPATGKLLHYGDGTLIACREHRTRDGSVEGPYMIYHPGYDMYYLFVSYDSLKFKLEMLAGGRIADVSENNGWELVSHETGSAMELRLGDTPIGSLCSGIIKGIVTPCWDWERNTGTLMFTGLDRQGTAVWGKNAHGRRLRSILSETLAITEKPLHERHFRSRRGGFLRI